MTLERWREISRALTLLALRRRAQEAQHGHR